MQQEAHQSCEEASDPIDLAFVRDWLAAHADADYRAFQTKLIPTVDPARIVGVRVPELRHYARELARERPEAARAIMSARSHGTYEECLVHALLVNQVRDYDVCVAELERFLPCVDNWGVCDILSPKAFECRPPELPAQAARWIASGEKHPYTVRFGVSVFMKYYLDDDFDPSYLQLVCSVRSNEYYVRMMVAWYVATALAKQWDATLPVLRERRLDPWTHNKAIQKAVESRRIAPEQKALLRTLRV